MRRLRVNLDIRNFTIFLFVVMLIAGGLAAQSFRPPSGGSSVGPGTVGRIARFATTSTIDTAAPANGSDATPAYNFVGDTSSGMWWGVSPLTPTSGADAVVIDAGGGDEIDLQASNVLTNGAVVSFDATHNAFISPGTMQVENDNGGSPVSVQFDASTSSATVLMQSATGASGENFIIADSLGARRVSWTTGPTSQTLDMKASPTIQATAGDMTLHTVASGADILLRSADTISLNVNGSNTTGCSIAASGTLSCTAYSGIPTFNGGIITTPLDIRTATRDQLILGATSATVPNAVIAFRGDNGSIGARIGYQAVTADSLDVVNTVGALNLQGEGGITHSVSIYVGNDAVMQFNPAGGSSPLAEVIGSGNTGELTHYRNDGNHPSRVTIEQAQAGSNTLGLAENEYVNGVADEFHVGLATTGFSASGIMAPVGGGRHAYAVADRNMVIAAYDPGGTNNYEIDLAVNAPSSVTPQYPIQITSTLVTLDVPTVTGTGTIGGTGTKNTVTTSQPTCNAGNAGLTISYRKGSGGIEATSICACEEVAGVYGYKALSATGDCT